MLVRAVDSNYIVLYSLALRVLLSIVNIQHIVMLHIASTVIRWFKYARNIVDGTRFAAHEITCVNCLYFLMVFTYAQKRGSTYSTVRAIVQCNIIFLKLTILYAIG